MFPAWKPPPEHGPCSAGSTPPSCASCSATLRIRWRSWRKRSACTPFPASRRIRRLRAEGIIRAQDALLDRRRPGLKTQDSAQVRLDAHGRARLDEFATTIAGFNAVFECRLLISAVDVLLRIVVSGIDACERFFSEKPSHGPGVRRVTSIAMPSAIKATIALPIRRPDQDN